MSQQTLEVLHQYWGYSSFRPMQQEIIDAVLHGEDCLALLPTGGGKSICFQVPAICQPGICLVVSPLIALMKDQVFQLRKRGLLAEAIYSGMYYRDIDRILDNCIYGKTKFLYLSPERLMTDLARQRIKQMNVNLLAVDEAHCISQWGYDFRPSYLTIAQVREWLPNTPVLALTATATSEVIADIQDKLEFKKGKVFQSGFARSNLAYVVREEEGKQSKLLDILTNVRGTAIVYVRSRRRTKEIARYLQKNRFSADFYHAGLSNELRSLKQDAWISNQIRVMVATNAFGMGIDKADVRVVVHMDMPDSLEAYFQEAGRAGRDGHKSYAVLLYNQSDKAKLEYQLANAFPEMAEIRRTYQALGAYFQLATGGGAGNSYDFDIGAFAEAYQLEVVKVFNCLKILEQSGWIVLTEAVFVPSSLRVLVSKEKLYDYQLRHRRFDLILKTILRTYQGAFNNYVNIREQQLAKFLQRPVAELIADLQMLAKDRIIDYRPQKDKPQIIFPRQRVAPENMTIDQALYNFRKKRQEERIRKAIDYAERKKCRSQQLLYYFGQTDAASCGICDVCLSGKKQSLNTPTFERYKTKVRRLLGKKGLPLETVVDSFAPKRKEEVLKALEYMMEEGFVEQEHGLLFWYLNEEG